MFKWITKLFKKKEQVIDVNVLFNLEGKDIKVNSTQPCEEAIIQLRNMGKTQLEISQITGYTVNQVKGKIQKLLKEGRIERKHVKKCKA